MPLETGSYVSDLNPNNPTVTDPTSQGDDHIRLIKTALKTTFPNFTGAAVSSTQAQIDAAVSTNENGTTLLADAGAHFKTNTGDGFTNPAAGEVDVTAGGNVVAKLKSDKSASFQGDVNVTGKLVASGPGMIPIGMPVMWLSDTLPDAATWGTYAWCNGAEYQRSNTALFSVLGTTYGVGNGSTTANLPDLRETVPVGKGTMGGTTSPGRITNYALNALGALIGVCEYALGITHLPPHSHTLHVTQTDHSHEIPVSSGTGGSGSGQIAPGGGSTAGTQITRGGLANITVTMDNTGGGTAHDNVQPSFVCNYIIRTA